jgi:hypothetical protein
LKRKTLHGWSDKRKTLEEIQMMADIWRENNPESLQLELFQIRAFKLEWRDNENWKFIYLRTKLITISNGQGK